MKIKSMIRQSKPLHQLSFMFVILFLLLGCKNGASQDQSTEYVDKIAALKQLDPVQTKVENGMAHAYFASGCFWCVEAVYESVKGVKEVINGYSGGYTDDPTYEASNTGRTGHAEAVEVQYDPEVITFSELVDVYFGSQDPTQVNGQGPDRGSQYRSIIFYQDTDERRIVEQKKAELAKELNAEIAAEVMPFQKFWIAEDYHQDYERLHPNQPYIKGVSIPRLNRFKAKFPNLLKSNSKH